MAVRYVTDAETRSIIDLDECNDIIEGLFRDEHEGKVENKPTVELAVPRGGVFRIKAGGTYGYNTFGFKAYPFGGRYLITIYDLDTGLDGMVEARGLTEARTGAVSAIGTKYMAREDATTMGIIGTGREARAQLASICKVRPFKLIKAYSRSDENRRTFASEMSEKLGIEVVPVETSREAVHDVDVLTVITSASAAGVRRARPVGGHAHQRRRRHHDEQARARRGRRVALHHRRGRALPAGPRRAG